MSGEALARHEHVWRPGVSADAPVFLLLHGTGGDEHDLLPLGQMLSPGAALLSPRGNVLEQGAPRFFRRLAEGVFDLEDLHRRTAELGKFLDAAGSSYGFEASRLYAVGFSNGANIAASLMLSRPEALAGAVLMRAMVPFEPDQPASLVGRAALLLSGRQVPIVPAAQAERLASILREGGADVEMAWQAGGHSLTSADVTVATRWLGERLRRDR